MPSPTNYQLHFPWLVPLFADFCAIVATYAATYLRANRGMLFGEGVF